MSVPHLRWRRRIRSPAAQRRKTKKNARECCERICMSTGRVSTVPYVRIGEHRNILAVCGALLSAALLRLITVILLQSSSVLHHINQQRTIAFQLINQRHICKCYPIQLILYQHKYATPFYWLDTQSLRCDILVAILCWSGPIPSSSFTTLVLFHFEPKLEGGTSSL